MSGGPDEQLGPAFGLLRLPEALQVLAHRLHAQVNARGHALEPSDAGDHVQCVAPRLEGLLEAHVAHEGGATRCEAEHDPAESGAMPQPLAPLAETARQAQAGRGG